MLSTDFNWTFSGSLVSFGPSGIATFLGTSSSSTGLGWTLSAVGICFLGTVWRPSGSLLAVSAGFGRTCSTSSVPLAPVGTFFLGTVWGSLDGTCSVSLTSLTGALRFFLSGSFESLSVRSTVALVSSAEGDFLLGRIFFWLDGVLVSWDEVESETSAVFEGTFAFSSFLSSVSDGDVSVIFTCWLLILACW